MITQRRPKGDFLSQLPEWQGSPLDLVIGTVAIALCVGVSAPTVQRAIQEQKAVPGYRVKYGQTLLLAIRRVDAVELTASLHGARHRMRNFRALMARQSAGIAEGRRA